MRSARTRALSAPHAGSTAMRSEDRSVPTTHQAAPQSRGPPEGAGQRATRGRSEPELIPKEEPPWRESFCSGCSWPRWC